jgi:hypothetical protein
LTENKRHENGSTATVHLHHSGCCQPGLSTPCSGGGSGCSAWSPFGRPLQAPQHVLALSFRQLHPWGQDQLLHRWLQRLALLLLLLLGLLAALVPLRATLDAVHVVRSALRLQQLQCQTAQWCAHSYTEWNHAKAAAACPEPQSVRHSLLSAEGGVCALD